MCVNLSFSRNLVLKSGFAFSCKSPVLLVYLLFVALNLRDHELWRDEIQAWLIAKVSANPFEVITNVRYEGRPPLWHEILWVLTRISNSPESLKLLNFLLIFATAITLYRVKNLSTLLFSGLLFGFYYSYGYSVVSRDYTFILFLITILVYCESEKRNKSSKITAILLAFTNFFGLTFAIGYFVLIAYRERKFAWNSRLILERLAYIFILGLAIFLTFPPADSNFESGFEIYRIKNMLSTIALPFLPFHNAPLWIQIGIAALIFLLWFLLSREGQIFLSPVVFLLLLNSVFGVDFYWWHKGIFFFSVLFALYLSYSGVYNYRYRKILKLITSFLLSLQILGSFLGIGSDFRNSVPYSNSKSASLFIKEMCEGSCTLISDNSVFSSSISAYLDAQPIYALPEENFVTYKIWKNFNGEVSWNSLVATMKAYPNSIGIVSTLNLLEKPPEVSLIGEFSPSVWGDNYSVYVLRK
jgi:hypothetical protein